MEQETWKDIPGFEGYYQVSNLGKVKSIERVKSSKNRNGHYSFLTKEKLLSPALEKGYKRVRLQKPGYSKMYRIHRLVAVVFLDNPENKQEVNHINAIKSDNTVGNLEWATCLENNHHARINNLFPPMKQSDAHKNKLKDINSKKVVDTKTGFIYSSATDAAIAYGFKKSTLIHYLLGTRKNKTTLIYPENCSLQNAD